VNEAASAFPSSDTESPLSPREWADRYASAGWLVFPVHSASNGSCSCGNPGCSSPGKHPRTKEGLKEGTSEPRRIDGWWGRWPDANIGLVTGAASGIVVLDVDVDKEGEATLSALEKAHGELPTTVIAATGSGGLHYLFRHPGSEVRNSAGKLGPGLDVRGDGGYIVAPPSRHVSGGTYSWLFAPQETELAEIPGWLLGLATETPPRAQRLSTVVSGFVGEGGRNMELTRIAGGLRRDGLGEEELREALRAVSQDRMAPPLPEAEVDAIAASIARYPVKQRPHRLTDYGAAERLIDRHGADIRFVPGLGWHGWDGSRWQRDTTGEIVRRMKQTIRAEWLTVPEFADHDERVALVRFLNRSESSRGLKAAIEVAQTESSVVALADDLDASPWLLTVENGTLDLQTGELLPFRREDLITLKAERHTPPTPDRSCGSGFSKPSPATTESCRGSCNGLSATRSRGQPARRCCSSATAPPRQGRAPSSRQSRASRARSPRRPTSRHC
jgi:putative DNA primase/helicase